LVGESITITGTYYALPTITVHIDAETNMTAIRLTNNTTLDWIEVARSFSAGEDLIIDCENETVRVGGVNVDFDGVFTRFDVGTNSFDLLVTDSGAKQYDLLISYYASYL